MLFNLMKKIGGAKNNFLVRRSPQINTWRYAAGSNKSIGGPFIFMKSRALMFSTVRLLLKSVQIKFMAENHFSSSDVEIGMIFSKLINGTKPAGIILPSQSKNDLNKLKFVVKSRSNRLHRYSISFVPYSLC